MEVLSKTTRVGLLLQPKTIRSQVANDIVATGTTSNAWTNPAQTTDTFFSVVAEAGSVTENANVSMSTLNATGSTTIFAERDRTYINTESVLPTVDMTIYCTPTVLNALLMGALQSTAENSVAPYEKTHSPSDLILNYKNNEGYLFSVAGTGFSASAGISDSFLLTNAVVNTLTISMSNALGDAEPRLMKAQVQFIGTDLQTDVNIQNFTTQETYIFNSGQDVTDAFTNLSFSFEDGSNYTANFWKAFELSINNNYFSDSVASDGKPNNMKRGNPEITVSFDFPYNDITYSVLSKYRQGKILDDITFKNGKTVNDLGYFELKSQYAVLTDNPRAYDGDFLSIKMSAKLLKGTSWGTYIKVVDNKDWSEL